MNELVKFAKSRLYSIILKYNLGALYLIELIDFKQEQFDISIINNSINMGVFDGLRIGNAGLNKVTLGTALAIDVKAEIGGLDVIDANTAATGQSVDSIPLGVRPQDVSRTSSTTIELGTFGLQSVT